MLMKLPMKETLMIVALAVAVLLLIQVMGTAYGVRVLVEASCYAIIALGLTIQWGYAGLFNAGIMGFVAIGGFSAMLLSSAFTRSVSILPGMRLFTRIFSPDRSCARLFTRLTTPDRKTLESSNPLIGSFIESELHLSQFPFPLSENEICNHCK